MKHTTFKGIGASLAILMLVLSGCTAQDAISVNVTNLDALSPVVIQGISENGSRQSIKADNISGGLVVVDTGHYALHGARFFGWTYVNQAVAGSGNVSILLITPAISSVHFEYAITTDAAASLRIYETTNVSNNGTAQTIMNHNREVNSAPLAKLFLTPTISSNGTLISVEQWGAGKTAGGTGHPASQWVLSTNTSYLLFIKNETGSTMVASVSLFWFRHE